MKRIPIALSSIFSSLALLLVLGLFAGCGEEPQAAQSTDSEQGTFEKIGESMDETQESAEETVDSAKKTAEEIEKATDDSKSDNR